WAASAGYRPLFFTDADARQVSRRVSTWHARVRAPRRGALRLRILFLSPRQCWPAQSGAKLREFHFAKALARDAEVTYVYFATPGSPPVTRDEVPFFREIVAIPKPEAYGLKNLMAGVLGRWPLLVVNYMSPGMSTALEGLSS